MTTFLQVTREQLDRLTAEEQELAYIGIGKLKMRFENKINPSEYYLSYSGGRDSHLLYWFIKEFLHDTEIKIVGLNTYREHAEIRNRIYKNCDIVLTPTMKMTEINEKYGIPCFTKEQDWFIYGYQKAIRENREIPKSYKAKVEGTYSKGFSGISKKARELVLSGNLHMVSSHCCTFTKKQPLKKYAKESGLHPIMGIMGAESQLRKAKYKSCLSGDGKFTPLYDFTNDMVASIEKLYNIEVPELYKFVSQTGCICCPYARSNEIMQESKLVTKNQLKYALDSFCESYKIKGIYDQLIKVFSEENNNG